MTILRRDPTSISNYFHSVLDGIGHRGSSFADVDAVTHDGRTDRFLFQEFKREHEALSPGQQRLLEALAVLPGVVSWIVRKQESGALEVVDVARDERLVLSADEYREKFSAWWNAHLQRHAVKETMDTPLRVDEIRW